MHTIPPRGRIYTFTQRSQRLDFPCLLRVPVRSLHALLIEKPEFFTAFSRHAESLLRVPVYTRSVRVIRDHSGEAQQRPRNLAAKTYANLRTALGVYVAYRGAMSDRNNAYLAFSATPAKLGIISRTSAQLLLQRDASPKTFKPYRRRELNARSNEEKRGSKYILKFAVCIL